MANVEKRDLVRRISESIGCKQYITRDIVQSFLDEMVKELAKGNRLEFREFGIFQPIVRKPRLARNPKTGEKVQVPARAAIHFKPGRLLRKAAEKMTDEIKENIRKGISDRARKTK